MYSSTVSTQEKVEERPPAEEFEEGEVADDVRETVSEAVVKKVKVPEVWREVLKTSSGRDKAFVGSLWQIARNQRLRISIESAAIHSSRLFIIS